jgi:sugar diacid utilization regulator
MSATDERLLGEVRQLRRPTVANGFLASLVHLAVESEEPGRLLAAAVIELGRALGLVGTSGEALAHAPDDENGCRALTVATTAATTGEVAPSGWMVMPIDHASYRMGFLAVAVNGESGETSWPLLELLATLLGEQLKRAALLRTQRMAFVRRLVSDTRMDGARARHEAPALGLGLAAAYWPAVLAWRSPAPAPDLVEAVDREVSRLVSRGLTAILDAQMIVLLHPCDDGASSPFEWFEQAVRRARSASPASHAQAIAAEGPVELDELSAHIANLACLRGFVACAKHDQPVVSARHYALDRLLGENVATPTARSFVRDRVGLLITWDQEHHTDLLDVLEAALDFPRHDQAASRCFMHRNTFRRRLRQATQVLGDSLEDADVRLAVHVALKLRRAPGVRR